MQYVIQGKRTGQTLLLALACRDFYLIVVPAFSKCRVKKLVWKDSKSK